LSTNLNLQISQIGQIAIPVEELERAVAFYRDVLGLPFLFQASGLAFFQCGNVRLMLSRPEGPDAPTRACILYYKVDDLHHAYGLFQQQGVRLVGEPHLIAKMGDHDLWMFFFEDTEGNMAALMSELPSA
jgi:methylmalonyl-CoA/ethylmalonyl-CoA epimerase